MIGFNLSNVSIFLEPPAKMFPEYVTKVFVGNAGVNRDDIPENFFRDAGKELGWERELDDYMEREHTTVQFVDRISDLDFEATIANKAHTKNLWDCCYSIFDAKVGPQSRVSMLAEYEFAPDYPMDEKDRQFLFFECKKRYSAILQEYRFIHTGCSDKESLGQAWLQVSGVMLEIYGIPADRMEAIVKEGNKIWNPAVQMDTSVRILSSIKPYPHSPKFYFVPAEPKKKIYPHQIVVSS